MKTKKNQIWNANEAIEFEVAGENLYKDWME